MTTTKTTPIDGTPKPLRSPYIISGPPHLLAYGKHEQVLRARCRSCKALYDIPVTPEQFAEFNAGAASRHIQAIMPNLSADDRELLISGTCGTCFDKMFAEDDEPDEDEVAAAATAPPIGSETRVMMESPPCQMFSGTAEQKRLAESEARTVRLELVAGFERLSDEQIRDQAARYIMETQRSHDTPIFALALIQDLVRRLAIHDTATTYKGQRVNGEADAFVSAAHKALHRLAPRNDVRNHSPDGFEWGYGGSGPTQLALALCIHALGGNVPRAEKVYVRFRERVIGKLAGDAWEMTQADVIKHVESIEQEMNNGT